MTRERKFYVVIHQHAGMQAYAKFDMLGQLERTVWTKDDATAFTSYDAARYVADFAQDGTCHDMEVISHG